MRALRTINGARLALARLYHQVSLGEVDPAVAGKLTHILSVLIGSARAHEFDQRLAEIEGTLAAAVKPNGHDAATRRRVREGRSNDAWRRPRSTSRRSPGGCSRHRRPTRPIRR